MNKIASFDIFDTTLIRKCGNPQNIFHLLALSLYPTDEQMQESFYTWRVQAEKKCKEKGKENPNISDIYSNCPFLFPQNIMSREMEIECENLTASNYIRDIIIQKRTEGYTIIFISDMYLPSSFLEKILEREECIEKGETIFVSCEQNARKDTGEIFYIVRNKYAPLEWIHYGDNKVSDYKMPLKVGIKAFLYKTQHYFQECKIQKLGYQQKDGWKFDIIAGILHCLNAKDFKMPSMCKIAINHIAPTYLAYIIWIIRQSKKRNIKRLYFLSRDSYILKEIAQSIYNKDIDSRFFFVSRKSLTLAFLHISDAKAFLSILDGNTTIGKNIPFLLSFFQISTEEFKDRYGIKMPYHLIRTKEEEKEFLNSIYKTDFIKDFRKRTTDNYNLVMDYFRQEGLADNANSAMVDVGWLGTTRLMINTLLGNYGIKSVPFFYYGVRADVISPAYGNYFSFTGIPNRNVMNAVHLLEQYYSAAPYPSTIGYRHKGNMIRPVFKEHTKSTNRIITNYNIDGCIHMAEHLKYFEMLTDEQLFLLAQNSVNTLLNAEDCSSDYSPLTMAEPTDKIPFAIRYNICQSIRYLVKGEMISAIDTISADITFGKQLKNPLILIHRVSHAINSRVSKILKRIQ